MFSKSFLPYNKNKMIRFYRDVLGFEIKESEDTSNVYLVKDETLFLLYGRKDFENMTHRYIPIFLSNQLSSKLEF